MRFNTCKHDHYSAKIKRRSKLNHVRKNRHARKKDGKPSGKSLLWRSGDLDKLNKPNRFNKSNKGATVLEVLAVMMFVGVMLGSLMAYKSVYKPFQTVAWMGQARSLAERAEVWRQGSGVGKLPSNADEYFSDPKLEVTYRLEEVSSSARAAVSFESAGHRHTVFARASRLTRGVLDKVLWYQERVK